MMRYVLSFCSILVVTSYSAAADSKKLTLRWFGQSFFQLESSQGTRIVFDPHAIDVYGRPSVKADLVLISHFHNDHTQVDVIENRDKKVLAGLKGTGKKIDWNPIDEKFRDVHIRTVGVYHDTMQGMERGKNAVFIVKVDGLHFVHLGDLGHLLSEDQVKNIGPVDVLMIPVGGVFTINGAEAQKVVQQLKPTMYIIPMHYGTKVFDDVLPADEFLEDQPKDIVKQFPTTNKLIIETQFKPPRAIIAVLNWK